MAVIRLAVLCLQPFFHHEPVERRTEPHVWLDAVQSLVGAFSVKVALEGQERHPEIVLVRRPWGAPKPLPLLINTLL